MGKQMSFSKLERKFSPNVREKVNNAENVYDLEKNFAVVVNNFLQEAMKEENFEITGETIQFKPEEDDHFFIEKKLKNNKVFKEIWENSDLKNVIKRFADSAYHWYLHLEKHNEKTNKKIRN